LVSEYWALRNGLAASKAIAADGNSEPLPLTVISSNAKSL